MGYTPEFQILNAANYGARTARERLVVIARRGSRAPVWPTATHAQEDWVPFSSVIEPHKGKSISNRPKPLVDATMRKIEIGRRKFGDRFLVEYYSGSSAASVDKPLPTITTRDRFALVDGDTYRLLTNTELAAAQGFPADYQFCGNKTEVTCQIGNSVSPLKSMAICRSLAG